MTYQGPFQITESKLIDSIKVESPIVVLEKLINEFNQNGVINDHYQGERLSACLAVLHAKKLDWAEVESQIKLLSSKDLICHVLIDCFVLAEKQFKDYDSREGLEFVINHSVKILVNSENKWPETGAFLAYKCSEYRSIAADLKDEIVTNFFRSIDEKLGEDVWSSIRKVTSIIKGIEIEDIPDESAQAQKALEHIIDSDATEAEYISIGLDAILISFTHLQCISPIDAHYILEEFLSLVSRLQYWNENHINQIKETSNEPDIELMEFVNENSVLYQSLLLRATELVVLGKSEEAIIVIDSLVNILPSGHIHNYDDYLVLSKVLIGVQLLYDLLNLVNLECHERLQTSINLLKEKDDIEKQIEMIGGMAMGWLTIWKEVKEEFFQTKALEYIPSLSNILIFASEILSSEKLKFSISISELFKSENEDSSVALKESLAVLHHQLYLIYDLLNQKNTANEHHEIFNSMAISVLLENGISLVDYDEDGPASLFLDCLQQLLEQGNLEQARGFAQKFDSALFLGARKLKFDDASLYNDNPLEEVFNTSSIHQIKQRFMYICAEAGFFDLALGIYKDLLATTPNSTSNFLYLETLAKGLRVSNSSI